MTQSIKIGIIAETKIPEDNRVALTPEQVARLTTLYPNLEFHVQSSPTRAYSDAEYAERSVSVKQDVSDCDILFGVKEAEIDSLISNKHYFFFGHIAKEQPYNRGLLQQMMQSDITFSDYEYLVGDDGLRLVAFGWWAGVVGAYNSMRAYGIREKLFELPKPGHGFTLDQLVENVTAVPSFKCKTVITGVGRSSRGAQFVLNHMGFKNVSYEDFLQNDFGEPVYTLGTLDVLIERTDGHPFVQEDFYADPSGHRSLFYKLAAKADVFISCHFWRNEDPVYLNTEELVDPNLKIKVIGDVTADIMGSIKSTVRASTHDEPFYDYNPKTGAEEPAFSDPQNITVMAVDSLPNALARDTSRDFGEKLSEFVIKPIAEGRIGASRVIADATILVNGELTESFKYLQDFADGK